MDIGAPELIIILIIAIFIFGPGRIASLGRELGASIREFRQGLDTPPKSDDTDSSPPEE